MAETLGFCCLLTSKLLLFDFIGVAQGLDVYRFDVETSNSVRTISTCERSQSTSHREKRTRSLRNLPGTSAATTTDYSTNNPWPSNLEQYTTYSPTIHRIWNGYYACPFDHGHATIAHSSISCPQIANLLLPSHNSIIAWRRQLTTSKPRSALRLNLRVHNPSYHSADTSYPQPSLHYSVF